MDVPVPYEVVIRRHNTEWKDIVQKIWKGKSKNKHTDPSTWGWSYSWGTRIGSPNDYDGSLVPFPSISGSCLKSRDFRHRRGLISNV